MKKSVLTFLFAIIAPLIGFSQPFATQGEWENYFRDRIHLLDPIEGIWSNSHDFTMSNQLSGKVITENNQQVALEVIYKAGNKYMNYEIGDGADNIPCEMSFINSASRDIYLMTIYYRNTKTTKRSNAILTGDAILEFAYETPPEELKHFARQNGREWFESFKATYDHQWLKIFPSKLDFVKSNPASGTGFGISSNGIIVTNFHVIEGARTIKVRGVNSNFNITYKANILVSDKNNDLALIRIDDPNFTSLGTTPFAIKTSLAGVGDNIFVLGYPLRATMGDEIKLTNGIISSRTGFQGDITTYQISAPVQPGNSGGPLFDNQGNLIGIINAKHNEAENASYAVKANYLTGLIDLIPNKPKLSTNNLLAGKSLTQQVELVKNFIYIIEVD